jgi:hypothetical protein
MDDPTFLFDEVLWLAMQRQSGEATEEELNRLKQLLGTNRKAVMYYLKIMEDGAMIPELARERGRQTVMPNNAGSLTIAAQI